MYLQVLSIHKFLKSNKPVQNLRARRNNAFVMLNVINQCTELQYNVIQKIQAKYLQAPSTYKLLKSNNPVKILPPWRKDAFVMFNVINVQKCSAM